MSLTDIATGVSEARKAFKDGQKALEEELAEATKPLRDAQSDASRQISDLDKAFSLSYQRLQEEYSDKVKELTGAEDYIF